MEANDARGEHSAFFATTVTTRLNVNGKAVALAHDVDLSLLDFVCDNLGLTGTKKGCDQGACGAFTLVLNGQTPAVVLASGS